MAEKKVFDQHKFNLACSAVVQLTVRERHLVTLGLNNSPGFDAAKYNKAAHDLDEANAELVRQVQLMPDEMDRAHMMDDLDMLRHIAVALQLRHWEQHHSDEPAIETYSPLQEWFKAWYGANVTGWMNRGASKAIADAAKEAQALLSE